MRYPTRGDKINQLGLEMAKTDVTRYGFEINAGNSWTCSKTTLTCHSSNLDDRMKNPVYLEGIIAFNPIIEQARLIQIDFPQGLTSRILFAHGVNSLSLVSWKEEIIYVYALKNILRIDKNRVDWYVEAYNGKCLVLQSFYNGGVVPVDDLIANKWEVMCSVPIWCDANRDFFLSTPSSSSVVGLDEILACGDRSISSLRLIMGLVDGSLSEKVEKQHGAMQIENTLYEQDTNKKRRMV
ncbi:hypothetical protein Bca52824_000618 [Brassica carinata]|uniref:F-box associated domain-containing protein n=1 Tax=Brassica carinata TaxID=52824 RepID=A0A8X8BCH8_BRACI|nr:hypothetical protein Bca52824_000618 [Brassica carinata]